MCVYNFHVRFRSLKRLDIFSWNFTQMLNPMRRRAEHMKHKSGFPTLGYIAFCVLTIFNTHSISLKPLDIFMKLHTNVKHHKTIEHMNHNSGFPTFGVIALCVLTIFVSTP